MRQCRWMEYLEDYDFIMHYHPGKENVVEDARGSRTVRSTVQGSGLRCFGELSGYTFLTEHSD